MSSSVTKAIETLWAKVHSSAGFPFPQTVTALIDLNVPRYHVDYMGCTTTSYIRDTASRAVTVHVASIPSHGSGAVGTFNREQLKVTLQAVIRGKLTYPEFASGCIDAGVVGYIAFIDGKRVVYYGEKGDHHVEWFPGAGSGALD